MATLNSRFWGFVPLVFFGLKAWQYRSPADVPQLLWFCNVSNIILSVAIFWQIRNLVFICAVLLSIGLPIWIFDFSVNGDFHIFSVFTHVLSPLLAFLVARNLSWTLHVLWQVPVYYVCLQVLARILTPAELNINVAFAVYAPVKILFPNFWFYSAVNLVGLLLFTAFTHRVLHRNPR
ncbi:MAG: hypothetical protein LDLANPLL_00974 [Turneriella sp.]|nr:hypothetical protein [Turneriella sp.]